MRYVKRNQTPKAVFSFKKNISPENSFGMIDLIVLLGFLVLLVNELINELEDLIKVKRDKPVIFVNQIFMIYMFYKDFVFRWESFLILEL